MQGRDSSGHGVGAAEDSGDGWVPREDTEQQKWAQQMLKRRGKRRNAESDGSWACFKGKNSSDRGSMTLSLTLDAGSWPSHTSVALLQFRILHVLNKMEVLFLS